MPFSALMSCTWAALNTMIRIIHLVYNELFDFKIIQTYINTENMQKHL
jgi:hypothetical protein